MPLLTIVFGITLLFVLIAVFKLNAFISFIIVCLFVGIAEGMPVDAVVSSIQTGIGNTLGFLVIILGFGSMLGKLVADSGAAQKITSGLISKFGTKHIQWAVVIAGFIVGIPMFYSVGFVILIPLVFTVAHSTRLPLIFVGLPMLASLSVTHGFLPPHPAPTAIASIFGADVGKTMLYGIVIAIPAIIVAGPLYSRRLVKVKANPIAGLFNQTPLQEDQMPGIWTSIISALLPVILIATSTIANYLLPTNSWIKTLIVNLGNPTIAMLISVLVAVYTLGIARGRKIKEIMDSLTESIASITMVLLIIAGAGALKQILTDSGVSDHIAGLLTNVDISPLILGWLIATLLRVCVGSATVAGLTAAGIVMPLLANSTTPPELMVLAIGSGSLMLSHVNDGGFWMFKEYFGLSIKETLSTWTVMETTVGIMGLLGVLILNTIL